MDVLSRRLDPSEAKKRVREKLEWVLRHSAPRRVYLFGSAYRGSMTEASDIDLVLVFDSREEAEAARRVLAQFRHESPTLHDLIFESVDDFERKSARQGSICHEASHFGVSIVSEGILNLEDV